MSDFEIFDPFINCINDDGTYNGLKFMSQISGIPEDEVMVAWEKAKKARKDA